MSGSGQFKIGDWAENRLNRHPGLTAGKFYCVVDMKTGLELNLGYNYALLYPLIRDDMGHIIPIHPDHLIFQFNIAEHATTAAGAEEYDEIMQMVEAMGQCQ